MRTRNSLMNLTASILGQMINVFAAFAGRKVFVWVLSKEYLGANGLFTGLLGVLSLAELGVGTALVYALYKPIADGDEKRTAELMNLYRILYRCIGAVILAAGLALLPFLDILIKDPPDIRGLQSIYLLFLGNAVFGYFFAYKQSLIIADQKAYITTVYINALALLRNLMQIAVLLLTKNFYLYLFVMITETVAYGILISRKADAMYPFLRRNKRDLPDRTLRRSIFKNIGAMSVHRISGAIVYNTDNLLMSAFVGLENVGIYANYQMIIQSVTRILAQVFAAFTASVGNLSVSEDREKIRRVFETLQFACFWCYSFSAVALFVLMNHFIESVWIGEGYLFTMGIVALLAVNFYLTGMRQVILIFRDAMGIFWHDRYKPIAEVLINLVASLWLVQKFGIAGIFLGTMISTLATSLWVDPYIFFKYGLDMYSGKALAGYFGTYLRRTAVMAAAGTITYGVCGLLPQQGFLPFLGKTAICAVLYNGILLALYGRCAEFKALCGYLGTFVPASVQRKITGKTRRGSE